MASAWVAGRSGFPRRQAARLTIPATATPRTTGHRDRGGRSRGARSTARGTARRGRRYPPEATMTDHDELLALYDDDPSLVAKDQLADALRDRKRTRLN